MKEFDKHECSICDKIEGGCPSEGCGRCTQIQKAGWKTALEWVLDGGFEDVDGEHCILADDIREELDGDS